MTEQEIFLHIKKIIKDDLEIEAEVTLDTWLLRDQIMDSMDWLSFLFRLEELHGIVVSPDEADEHQIGIVKNLIVFLQGRI